MNEIKTCGMIGIDKKEFPWRYSNKNNSRHQKYLSEMSSRLNDLIRNENVKHFICGADDGANRDFANIVIGLKHNTYKDITLEIVIPFRDMPKYDPEYRAKPVTNIVAQADSVKYIINNSSAPDVIDRNLHIAYKSDLLFIFLNERKKSSATFNTYAFLKNLDKPLELFTLNDY